MSILSTLGLSFAGQWIAGTSISSAIAKARKVNELGERVLINYLGEELKEKREVGFEIARYIALIDAMQKRKIKGDISVKPTQLGLSINEKLFAKSLDKVTAYASRHGVFVWIDMEDYNTVDPTLKVFSKTFRIRKNIGICVQAKLRRTYGDLKMLSKMGARIRLVKGAYKYSDENAFPNAIEVDANFLRCAEYLFRNADGFMVATHDDKIIERCRELEKRHKKQMSFAMLRGVRGPLAKKLAEEGERVYIYLPFGGKWFSYSVRRLREEGHAALILRSFLQG